MRLPLIADLVQARSAVLVGRADAFLELEESGELPCACMEIALIHDEAVFLRNLMNELKIQSQFDVEIKSLERTLSSAAVV